tara:strand:- start:27 stop:947 length:921 start_codon:yes stop_codon:yes gene_type:complete
MLRMPEESTPDTRCGYIAIVGKPNVGKSTLVNRILGQKLNITSRKPQTTRHQLLGIKTTPGCQFLYVDTPGIHGHEGRAMNRYMNRSALAVLQDVDVAVLVLERLEYDEDDARVVEFVSRSPGRQIVVINKVDQVEPKERLLPHLAMLSSKLPEAEFVPLSALKGDNVEVLEEIAERALPQGPFYFPDDQITDRSERFLVAEIIREKMMRQLSAELPYALTVQIEAFRTEGQLTRVEAVVLVERDSQKAILIGKGGQRLKRIGSQAREDIERLLDRKVMLRTWVRVKTNWSDDERALKSLGFGEDP